MTSPKSRSEEIFKGAIHAATAGLAATMCLYNGLRCCQEDATSQHKVNVVVYGLLWGFECKQTYHHWRSK